MYGRLYPMEFAAPHAREAMGLQVTTHAPWGGLEQPANHRIF